MFELEFFVMHIFSLELNMICLIFGMKGHASRSNTFKEHKILIMASIYILEELSFYKRVSYEY
jgi:hypothetical protein